MPPEPRRGRPPHAGYRKSEPGRDSQGRSERGRSDQHRSNPRTGPKPPGQDPRRQGADPGRREDDRPVRRQPEPHLPDDIDPKALDRSARAGLRSLPDDLAEKVAKHLVAAGEALDDDPTAALTHARYARSLAPRLAVVREATGVAAYRCGEYAEALSELRAVRRMTGDPSYLPIMADCERGLSRPERALTLTRDPERGKLATAERVELAIVASGARRDLGEHAAAVVALQGPLLDRSDVQPWTVRLWYAYAAALLDAGRTTEAVTWFTSVVAIDEDDDTDAEERLAALESADPSQ